MGLEAFGRLCPINLVTISPPQGTALALRSCTNNCKSGSIEMNRAMYYNQDSNPYGTPSSPTGLSL